MISIIIPVYNAEQFIEKCIESVLNQTYRDFEVIFVISRESNDKSAEICNVYAERDGRVKVVLSEANGVAGARNIGMGLAIGEFIGFVDSDDYVEPDMFEKMIATIQSDGSDMAICGYCAEFIKDDTNASDSHWVLGTMLNEGVASRQDVIKGLACGKVENFLWNKLFKRELFDGISFPQREIFEDASVLYKLVDVSNGISVINAPLYHYCKRKSSLTGKSLIRRRIASFEYFDEFYDFVNEKYPDMVRYCGLLLYGLCVTMANTRLKAPWGERRKYRDVCLKHYSFYHKELHKIEISFTLAQKIAIRCFLKMVIFGDFLGLGIEFIRRNVFRKER